MQRKIRLAYRDDDRTPVIFCIREMAARYYDTDVEIVRIKGTEEYEAALFDDRCDILIEHLEYLYERAAEGEKITMFCAPSRGGNLELVVPAHVQSLEEFKGKTLAIRSSGQPHAVAVWLRMMGLEKEVKTLVVKDSEVGRWGQWKKVAAEECIATFTSPLYLPEALAAGLKALPVPEIPIVGHFAQACLSDFARKNSAFFKDYVKAVIHAVCLMVLRRDEALKIVSGEPRKRMKIESEEDLERQFDSIVRGLKLKPYPAPQALANTYEIATLEYPAAKGLNPLSLWDLHWVKELDDEGFIAALINQM
ncbi:MAG TPA: hypothetical protein VGR30_16970 [Candidatus Binatia bacterium]|jgi:hypothetical protein|nr:hypothetical protein [Candidatus Binatia bacterium]